MREVVFKITLLSTALSIICFIASDKTWVSMWFGMSILALAAQIVVSFIIKFVNWISK